MIVAIVGIIAVFAIIGMVFLLNSNSQKALTGNAYLTSEPDILKMGVESYADETSTVATGLRDCEMVSEQIVKDVAPGMGYTGEHEFLCPYGKLPIRTSTIPLKISGQPYPTEICDIDLLTSGGYNFVDGGGDEFDGMTGVIAYSNCNQVGNLLFEFSMTCCTP